MDIHKTIYQFTEFDISGNEVDFQSFQGKVVLIVNTASHCHFTPQYEGLEKIYRQYGHQGFIVLGFPCDQFGHQEPGPEERIKDFCQNNYGISFHLFRKTRVNGPESSVLFHFLKHQCL